MKNLLRVTLVSLVFTGIFVQQATASSYYSSASFGNTLRGATRSYSGSNITISMSGVTCNGCAVSAYNISLWRNVSWGADQRIGTSQCPSNYACQKTWTNVGSGNYYFYFERAADGGLQLITTVHMFNS